MSDGSNTGVHGAVVPAYMSPYYNDTILQKSLLQKLSKLTNRKRTKETIE